MKATDVQRAAEAAGLSQADVCRAGKVMIPVLDYLAGLLPWGVRWAGRRLVKALDEYRAERCINAAAAAHGLEPAPLDKP